MPYPFNLIFPHEILLIIWSYIDEERLNKIYGDLNEIFNFYRYHKYYKKNLCNEDQNIIMKYIFKISNDDFCKDKVIKRGIIIPGYILNNYVNIKINIENYFDTQTFFINITSKNNKIKTSVFTYQHSIKYIKVNEKIVDYKEPTPDYIKKITKNNNMLISKLEKYIKNKYWCFILKYLNLNNKIYYSLNVTEYDRISGEDEDYDEKYQDIDEENYFEMYSLRKEKSKHDLSFYYK